MTIIDVADHDLHCHIDGIKVTAHVVRLGSRITVFVDGTMFDWTIPDLQSGIADAETDRDRLTAPMPGLVKLVHVQAGDRVEENMPLAVMEAMKMEHTLKAPRDGIVEQRFVNAGDQVEEGVVLLALQPE